MEKIKLSFLAGLFSFFTIGVLSALTYKTDYGVFLIASFGSTMVILYGYPDSPFAQPKNIFWPLVNFICRSNFCFFHSITIIHNFTLGSRIWSWSHDTF